MSGATIYGTSALHVLCSMPPSAELAFGRVEPSVGGPAAVVACQLALLGHPPRFVGTVGTDSAGGFLLAELTRYGVDVSGVIDCDRTPRVLAMVGGGSVELTADVSPEQAAARPELWLADGPQGALPPDEPAYITGFPELVPVIKALGDCGRRLIVDVGYIPLLSDAPALVEHVRSISYAIGVGVLSGQTLAPKDRRWVIDTILDGGASAVLTTLGEDGVMVTTPEGTDLLPAFKVAAVDSLCAGDTFVAGFLCARMEGRDLTGAALFGQAVAAAKVSLFGGLATRAQAEALLPARRETCS